jgi:hypothetical protein
MCTSIGLTLMSVLGATILSAQAPSAERYTFAHPPAPESTVDSPRLGVTLIAIRQTPSVSSYFL